MSAARKTPSTPAISSTTSTSSTALIPPRFTLPTLPASSPARVARPKQAGAGQRPALQARPSEMAALQAGALPGAPGFVLATGGGSGACRKRPGPVAPRPPLLWARSCALTALLPPAVRAIIKEELGKRLERHFRAPQWNYPNWLFRDSEILWGQRAQMLHAGRALRGLSLKGPLGKDYGLLWLLLYDAERLARLVVERHPEHTRHERVACILGVLRRIGQIYRELRWRCGEQRALWHVRNALCALHWW